MRLLEIVNSLTSLYDGGIKFTNEGDMLDVENVYPNARFYISDSSIEGSVISRTFTFQLYDVQSQDESDKLIKWSQLEEKASKFIQNVQRDFFCSNVATLQYMEQVTSDYDVCVKFDLTIRDATATHCNECYEYDCNGGLVGIDYFGISDVALSDNGAVITIGAINTIGATLATARVKYSGYDVEYSVNMTLPFAGQGVLRIEAVGSNGMNAIWSLVVGESDTTTEGQILSVVSNAACGARQFNIIDFIAAPGTYYDAAYKVYQDSELMLEDEPISSQQYNGVTTIGSHNIRSVVSWNIDGNTELISENYIEYTINCQ